jgi:hypothetical protein
MPHTVLECQVSKMINSDTFPRPTTKVCEKIKPYPRPGQSCCEVPGLLVLNATMSDGATAWRGPRPRAAPPPIGAIVLRPFIQGLSS